MKFRFIKWIRQYYKNIINSIAFYPAFISVGFLLLSFLLLTLDFSPLGKSIKARWDFISLKDASTARSIAATIAAGILSLTVFSFSMVMILLNQAASNMSNRLLDSMIGNRFQQWVLGFYIGTIVYALFLLSTIREVDSGVHVPALSVYLLIVLTVIDIFLFIYFLHYITQSVKFETIIDRIHRQTKHSLEKYCPAHSEMPELELPGSAPQEISTDQSDYFQGFDRDGLLKLCTEENWLLHFYYPTGTYILKGMPILSIKTQTLLPDELRKRVLVLLDFHRGEPIDKVPYYGFKQLKEVALRALSPGINDPGTAVLSLHALTDLLAFRLHHYPDSVIRDEAGIARIVTNEITFEATFEQSLLPIWHYGQEDPTLQQEMQQMLEQLLSQATSESHKAKINHLLRQVKSATSPQ